MRHALPIALGAVIGLGACSVDEETPELGEIDYISYNALAPAAFLDNGDALNALAGAALNRATTDLVNSQPGRKLLEYVVRCALPTGQVATFPRPRAPDLLYVGVLGFAPRWMQAALDETHRRLMTGCLMAHVNAFEVEVPISVRSELMEDAEPWEGALFPAQELAVYGNYFAPPAKREVYVCFGQAVAQALGAEGGVGGGLPSYLDLRVCSTSDACRFNRVGACYRWSSIPEVTTSACEQQSGSFYESCHEAPIERRASPEWNETVSVYLQPGHLPLLLAEYRELICQISGGQVCLPGP